MVIYILTSSDIYFELESSTLVSDLYGLMRRILYIIRVTLFCNFTVPLVKNCVITNGPLYGVSYFYAVCLLSMKLSTLYIHSQLYVYSCGSYLY